MTKARWALGSDEPERDAIATFLSEVFCLSETCLKNLRDSMLKHRQSRLVVVGRTY